MPASKGLALILMYLTSTASGVRLMLHEEGNCMSATQKKFADILKNGNVKISDAGIVTLHKLKNIIPFQTIKEPSKELPAIAAGTKKYQPVMNISQPHVEGTLSDLKELLGIVGIKSLEVVGMAGGPAYMTGPYASGGEFYIPGSMAAWIKVAEARAEAVIQALGLQGHSGLTPKGEFGKTIGVRLSVKALLKIDALKAGQHDIDCGNQGDLGPVLTAEEKVAGIEGVLSHGRIDVAADESIEFKDPLLLHNTIPFERCTGVEGVDKAVRLIQCIEHVEIQNDKGQRQAVRDAMKDIADLAQIADVTSLEVVGYSRPGDDVNPDEAAAAQKLGAARARFLVKLLQEQSSTRVSHFADQVEGTLTACIESSGTAQTNSLCNPVSKFGRYAVEIRLATLVNTSALSA